MTAPPLFVGLDVGGTTMKAGVVDDAGRPLTDPVSLPTEPESGQEQGLATMAETVRRAVAAAGLALDRIAAVGVATPGTMDLKAGVILDPPNLKPWRNVPVRQFIADAFGKPTAFQNDANAAAVGEHWAGAGKGVRSLVLFTLGTGIGGGIIIDDRVLEGEHSHGAELGHTKIEMTAARLCGCGKRGCLEAYASATAVVQRAHEALNADRGRSALRGVVRDHGDLTARYLAVGAANLMHVVDPDVVAFAGGMTAAGESFLARIRAHVRDYAFPVPAAKCDVRYAELGSDAGFIGAAGCARQLWRKGREQP
jgi:glucokinase